MDAEVADSDLTWVANEGIRVSALVVSLSRQLPDRPSSSDPETTHRFDRRSAAHRRDPEPRRRHHHFTGRPVPFDRGADMSPAHFEFSGPVTIVVGAPVSASPGSVVPAVNPLAPPVVVPPDFREMTLKFDEDYKARTSRATRRTSSRAGTSRRRR